MNKKILGLVSSLTALVAPFTALAVTDLPGMVDHLAGQLKVLGASLAIIGFVIAGIMYITATANPSNMQTAKQALVAAIIGTVILILASSATAFVKGLTGV